MISTDNKTDDRPITSAIHSKSGDSATQPSDYAVPPHRTFEFTVEEAAKFEAFLAEENQKEPSPALLAAFAQRKRNQTMSRNHK